MLFQSSLARKAELFGCVTLPAMRKSPSTVPRHFHDNFRNALFAGEHYLRAGGGPTPHTLYQRNFEARQRACESALRSCIAELELDLPDVGIRGVYRPGQEYEYYRDVTACLKLAQKEIFIVDPYLSKEIFEIYADALPRTVLFRLLSTNVPADVQTLAQKYAAGGNLEFRHGASIQERAVPPGPIRESTPRLSKRPPRPPPRVAEKIPCDIDLTACCHWFAVSRIHQRARSVNRRRARRAEGVWLHCLLLFWADLADSPTIRANYTRR